ncbi:glycoside hydrolase family 5 protein [Sphingomonas sp.]|uniref:glycoside hydrolase family 5 protein n=1 Tax=Sphingomonas sp. TaxID=28214 RepID=UPI003B00E3BF
MTTRLGTILATLYGAMTCATATPATAAPASDRAATTAARLHRGVNVLGYDPIWTDARRARFQPRHFAVIRRGGFDFVRIVLQSFAHMDGRNRLDPTWLATLDRLIGQATAAGLSVIVDEHDFDICSDDPDTCEPKLQAFWRQIGARYRNQPATVLFELLNEPHGKLDAARWNAMLARLIPIVRATNPDRTLVIGPTDWNNLARLPDLALPADDRNILVTFHYYEPFRFTHQGASWTPETAQLRGVPFTADDAARIATDFDTAAAWRDTHHRPVMLGEFGAYDGSGTPVADRARYAATISRAAAARGFPWAYWQFDSDFVVYDIAHDRWVEPIRRALIGAP